MVGPKRAEVDERLTVVEANVVRVIESEIPETNRQLARRKSTKPEKCNDIQILHDLCKEETLSIIDKLRIRHANIFDARIRIVDFTEILQALRAGKRSVKVLLVSSHPPCMEVDFEDLWT